uniref:Endonuclease/exonuclease/phosphatase domain-containing protein n=1 Tax=Mola mola TaxID=94237 RepID=A0A3Q3W5Z1_MOLML
MGGPGWARWASAPEPPVGLPPLGAATSVFSCRFLLVLDLQLSLGFVFWGFKNPDLVFLDWVGKVLYSAGWLVIDPEHFGFRCTFMNIYAPTADLLGFFVEVSNEITQIGNSYVVLGGNFNNVSNPKVNKTYTWGITRPSQARKTIDTFEEELDLMDVWRYFHLSDKEFTFYSHPHISYSRIDYFLISKSLLSITEQTTIGTILDSIHTPL